MHQVLSVQLIDETLHLVCIEGLTIDLVELDLQHVIHAIELPQRLV